MYTHQAVHVLALLGLISLTEATPLTILQRLQRRANPCEPGGTPILYKEYGGDSCPPAISMDGSGNCPADPKKKCISYCEVRQEFTYDIEKPVDNGYCHGPLTCTVGSNKATTYTYSGSINNKWLDAFGFGITGGYSSGVATTDLRSTSVKLDEGQCGYFTFLPILHHSWYVAILWLAFRSKYYMTTTKHIHSGTVSEGTHHDVPINHCDNYQNSPNVCTPQAYRSRDGSVVLGDTIFVKIDCGTRARLPMDQQDPAYQHDGVAAPQNVIDTFITSQTPSYATGWCTAHITQYQKNEASGPSANGASYLFVVCLYDANHGNLIHWPGQDTPCTNVVAPDNEQQKISSDLPFPFQITAGSTDDAAVLFSYNGQNWGSNDQAHHSNFGSYDSGRRNGDTGFSC